MPPKGKQLPEMELKIEAKTRFQTPNSRGESLPHTSDPIHIFGQMKWPPPLQIPNSRFPVPSTQQARGVQVIKESNSQVPDSKFSGEALGSSERRVPDSKFSSSREIHVRAGQGGESNSKFQIPEGPSQGKEESYNLRVRS